jgi:hypothetical protein
MGIVIGLAALFILVLFNPTLAMIPAALLVIWWLFSVGRWGKIRRW